MKREEHGGLEDYVFEHIVRLVKENDFDRVKDLKSINQGRNRSKTHSQSPYFVMKNRSRPPRPKCPRTSQHSNIQILNQWGMC